MKTLCSLAAALLAALPVAAIEFTAADTEIAVDPKAPKTVLFAANELRDALGKALGAEIPLTRRISPGKKTIVLGTNAWSEAAGLFPARFPRDTFMVKTVGDRVYLAGCDDPAVDVRKRLVKGRLETFERATLFAVYEFLERFARCRFYFPGELGTVIPRAGSVSVPDTDIVSTPDCLVRKYYNHRADGVWFEKGGTEKTGKNLMWLRNRCSTTIVPCCHGTRKFNLPQEFRDSHPEYFALRADGLREDGRRGGGNDAGGHLCYSSKVRDVIAERTIEAMKAGATYVDIMPNDGFQRCRCPECEKVNRPAGDQNFATELVWDYTRYVAEKVAAAGFADRFVTQMAYRPYRAVPALDVPKNVKVMVAEGGPWSIDRPKSLAAQYAEIRAWKAKTGGKVWIWTYPHKFGHSKIKGVPDVAPKAWGKYYRPLKDDIFGTFAESETDCWIYHYLSYHVFGKVMWDMSADVDAIIAEHHRAMFGAAAGEMAEFYDALEDKWLHGITGNVKDTPLGPVVTPPPLKDVWTKVYSPEFIAHFDKVFDRALSKVQAGSIEARRLEFIRRVYLDAIKSGAEEWRSHVREVENLRWSAKSGRPIELVPYGKKSREEMEKEGTFVETFVTAKRTGDDLVVVFDCREPTPEDIASVERPRDSGDLWKDYSVEIFLNPSCDRERYFHLIVNANGSLFDAKAIKAGRGYAKADSSWDSGAKVDVSRREGSVVFTISIPLASLGDVPKAFPAEFCRSRMTISGKGHGLYHWSPWPVKLFDALEEFGTIEP